MAYCIFVARKLVPYWNKPFLMLLVVGRVIVALSKTPFITPTTMNPFIFVIDAVTTILFNPAIGY